LEKLVIIPTYNEKENIAGILHAVFSLNLGYHVLVIDDNSPDGTAAIVKGLFATYPSHYF
jgi:dolichol-phosphate mannosyltransferase